MRAWPADSRAQALAARGVARVATLGRRGAFRMLAVLFALTAQSAIASCSAADAVPIIEVAGSDYALIAPDTLPSGPTRFRFHSTGTVAHELAMARVKAGVSLAQVLATELRGGEVEALYDPGDGLLYASPGDRVEAELLLDLEPGRSYVLVCTLETDGKSHATLGMVRGLTVRAR